jgi:hypothetical protein
MRKRAAKISPAGQFVPPSSLPAFFAAARFSSGEHEAVLAHPARLIAD